MWRGSVDTELRIITEKDLNRVGNTWMKGRLKIGDLVLKSKHSGDCFFDYYLLDYTDYSNTDYIEVQAIPRSFGAYEMGDIVTKLDEQTYHAILAGIKTKLMIDLPDVHPKPITPFNYNEDDYKNTTSLSIGCE